MRISYREDGKVTKTSNMRILTHILVYEYMLKKSRENGSNEISYIQLIDDVAKQLQYRYFPNEMLYDLRLSVIGSVNTMINEYGLMWFRKPYGATYLVFEENFGDGSTRVKDWVRILREFNANSTQIKSSVLGLEKYFGKRLKHVVGMLNLSGVSDLLVYLNGTKSYLKESDRQRAIYFMKYGDVPTYANIKRRYELSVNRSLYGHNPFLKYMEPVSYVQKYKFGRRKVG